MAQRNTVQIIINAKDAASDVLGGVGSALGSLGKIAAVGAAAVGAATIGIGAALTKLALDAAPLAGIESAFEGLAASADIGADKMLAALERGSAGMIAQSDLMTSFNKAAQLVSVDFAQTLPDAMGALGKVAAATGEDMGFLLDSLVVGVGRLSPMILDNLGIQVSLAEANEAYAESIGVTVGELTKQQQQVALTNQVMEKLAENTAAMPDLAGTAAAGIAQFRATLKNTGDEIGLSLAPDMGRLIGMLNDLAQTVLPPIVGFIQNSVAPAFSLFVDGLGSLVGPITETSTEMEVTTRNARRMGTTLTELATTATSTGETFVSGLVSKLSSAAENALRWGVNITTQLATGLIQGAAQAITTAMQFISGMLEGWLLGKSPPKVAPDIDKWGAATMSEYLKGFTEASFDILEEVQSPLQSVLSTLVSAGEIGANAARNVFRDLSGELTVALTKFQETGEINEDIFKRLSEAGGEFGDDLAELARRQFELAAATTEVKAAEDALSAARGQEEKAQDDLTAAMGAFNQALAEGASPAILAQKRAEFEAAKQRLATSKEETKEAEKNKKSAKGKIKPLEEQVNLQARLLKQLTQLSSGQEEVAASAAAAMSQIAAAAGGGAAGISAPSISAGGFELPEIDTGSLDTVFDDAKERILETVTGIFQPLVDEWERLRDGPLAEMGDAWDELSLLIKEAIDTKVMPALEDAWAFIQDNWIPIVAGLAAIVLSVAVPAFIAWAVVAGTAAVANIALLAPILAIVAALVLAGAWVALLAKAWQDDWGGIRTFLTDVWEGKLKPIFDELKLWLDTNLPLAIEILREIWEEVLIPALNTAWEFIQDNIIPVFEAAAEVADAVLGLALRVLAGIWQNILKPALKVVWEFLKDKILPIFGTVSDFVENTLGPVLKWFNETILTPLKDAFGFIADAAENLVDWLNHIKDLIAEIEVPPWAQPGSPPPLADAFTDIGNAVRELATMELPRLQMQFDAMSPTGGDSGAATGGDSIVNNFFNQTINTQDSDAGLESINGFQDMRAMVRA